MENKDPKNQQPLQEEAAAEIKKIDTRKIIIAAVCVVVVALIAAIWWGISASQSKKADEAIALADLEYANDSIANDYYLKAAELGHKSGNRAKLNVAINYYDKGQYEQAIKYLDDASVASPIIDAGRLSLMGDCYVNLQQYDKAISCYNKAISASDNNPQVIPFVLVKMANVYREQKNYAAEYEAYDKIFNQYPEYAANLQFDIRKYAERARIAAGK